MADQTTENLYAAEANKQIAKIAQYRSQKDWNNVSNTNGTTLRSLANKVCSFPCYEASRLSQKLPQKWIDRVWNVNESIVKSDDPDAASWEILESGTNWRIVRQVNNMKWPVWPRELVFAQIRVDRDTGSYLVMYSVKHPSAPLKPSEFVRGTMHTNVYAFEQEENHTRASKITQIDPAGDLPVWLVTKYTDKLTHMLNKIDSEK